jgi:kynureninase
MNAGAGSIAGAFVHERHGSVVDQKGLRGWYGGDKSVRFLMDNSEFYASLQIAIVSFSANAR